MSLLRFVNASKEDFLRKNPNEQLELFESKINERNFVDSTSTKYDVKQPLIIGFALGALLYFSTKNITQGVSSNV
jgi:hypothetical protein